MIIDGKKESGIILDKIKNSILSFNTKPALAVVIIGDDPASQVYVKNKILACEKVGIKSSKYAFDSISETELLEFIENLNHDKNVNGILVQMPLPENINPTKIINVIDPIKDVDGFHPVNLGNLMSQEKTAFIPCTPLGCLYLIKQVNSDLTGKNAVVIGRSITVGKPVANLLTNNNATVTLAHSKTKYLKEICLNADILVAAVGKPEFIKHDFIKKGAIVIDVGINRIKDSEPRIEEVILALNPTMEGDTTAFYLTKKLKELGTKVTTIARGIPIGGELEYADEVTLGRSIITRTTYE